jgi:hypothetical protein
VGKAEETTRKTNNVGEWMILKWILERQDEVVWTGFIWLRMGTNGGLL